MSRTDELPATGWWCTICAAPAVHHGSSVTDRYQIGSCNRYPVAHARVRIVSSKSDAVRLQLERLEREHTAHHDRHVAEGRVSRYCLDCEDARHHSLHVKYRQGNERCHMCKLGRIPVSQPA